MRIKVLGSGQDAGIPHPGCQCGVCNRARKNARYKRRGASIAILNDRTKKKEGFCYLIDASPDFKHQLDMVRKEIGDVRRRGRVPVSGILLTHAHFGHVSGLWYLGNESVKESNLPVFCTPRIEHFLKRKHPFNLLVRRKNIKVRRILKSREVKIERFGCTPFSVPHRSDSIETVGYIIRSMKSKKTLVYVPDVDYWTDRVIDIIR
ncbi:MAG: MBL fold metallo-hydrolase, partial [Thermoplasmata archaeon]|nr:MBL fold metallo-hydrolase [Thermoplasmata archaeon]